MKISFFEEFPTPQNLATLKHVNWPTKLYIATSSLQEFELVKKRIRKKNIITIMYWPVLKKKEGYWISPFSERKALRRIFQELEGKRVPLMLDLELPTSQNQLLYITQSLQFFSNKRLIQDFIRRYQGDIYLAEYYPEGKRKEQLLQFWGLHYPHPTAKIIKMLYRSMHHFSDDFLRKELQKGREEYGSRFIPAFGVIAPGIKGNEPVLSSQQLEQDLQIAKRAGMKEVILFRLGGLNEKYGKILSAYARP